jgi:hypothetical protein
VDLDCLHSATALLLNRFKRSDRRMISNDDESVMVASCVRQVVVRAGDRITDRNLWVSILSCGYIGSFSSEVAEAGPSTAHHSHHHQHPVGNGNTHGGHGGHGGLAVEAPSIESATMLWSQAWMEGLVASGHGTKSAALQSCLPSVIQLLCNMLSDLSWRRRQDAIVVVNDLAKVLSQQQLAPNIGLVVLALLRAVQSRIWTGQSEVFGALAAILSKCSNRCVAFSKGTSTTDSHPTSRRFLFGLPSDECKSQIIAGTGPPGSSAAAGGDSAYATVIALEDYAQLSNPSGTEGDDNEAEDESKPTSLTPTVDSPVDAASPASFQQQYESFTHWVIDPVTLTQLFLKEASRGVGSYRLAAAKAISALPWTAIVARGVGVEAISALNELIAQLLEMVGVPTGCKSSLVSRFENYVNQCEIDKDSGSAPVVSVSSSSATAKPAVASTSSSSSSSVSSARAMNISTTARTNQSAAAKKSFELFGGRYGSSAPTGKAPIVSTVRKQAAPAVATTSAPTASSATSAPVANSNNSPNASGDVLHDLFTIISDYIPPNTEPAFRMQLVDCITSLQSAINGTVRSSSQGQDLLAPVLWCPAVVRGEVWSLKRSGLLLLAELLAAAETVNSLTAEVRAQKELINLIVESIRASYQESKYSKVRLAAMQCLQKLLQLPAWSQYLRTDRDCSQVIAGLVDVGTGAAAAATVSRSDVDIELSDTFNRVRGLWGKLSTDI